jgi:hypothetical protein
MVAGQHQFHTCVHFLVSVEVWDLHHVKQCGLHKVLGPWLWDNIQIISFGLGQVFMWGKHAIRFPVSKVEVTKL